MIFQQLKNSEDDIVNVAEPRGRIAFGVMKSSRPAKDVSKLDNDNDYLIAISESPWFNFWAAPIDPLRSSKVFDTRDLTPRKSRRTHTCQATPDSRLHSCLGVREATRLNLGYIGPFAPDICPGRRG
jgi:hypothetical protein